MSLLSQPAMSILRRNRVCMSTCTNSKPEGGRMERNGDNVGEGIG